MEKVNLSQSAAQEDLGVELIFDHHIPSEPSLDSCSCCCVSCCCTAASSTVDIEE